MNYWIKTAAAIVLAVAMSAHALAQHPPAAQSPGGQTTKNLQGDPGQFATPEAMEPFYEVLLEAHKQGDKVDLAAMEAKLVVVIEKGFNGGKPVSKAFADQVLGVAHQALAMGVSNPKMFESYKTFMATMMGPS